MLSRQETAVEAEEHVDQETMTVECSIWGVSD